MNRMSRAGTTYRVLVALPCLVFLLSFTAGAEAASRYVRAGAAGSGTGSDWTNAYPGLPSALTRGDTYYVADGTYSGYNFDDANAGTTTITIRKATIADHGTSVGWSDAFGDGQAVFTGGTNIATSYWVIDGVTGGGPASWKSNFGFKFHTPSLSGPVLFFGAAATNNVFRHVEVHGNGDDGGGQGNDGFSFYPGASNNTISYFWVHDTGRTSFIVFGSTTFEYGWFGTFEGNNAAEHAEVGAIWGGHIIIRWSVISHCEGTGGFMNMNNTGPIEIYGNVFAPLSGQTWSACSAGVIGSLTQVNANQTRFRVYNNSFIDIPVDGYIAVLGASFTGSPVDNIAKNNLFYSSGSSLYWSLFTTHNFNHYVDNGGNHGEGSGTTGAGNPFVNWQNTDFRLAANTTPGEALPAPYNVDMFGSVRTTRTRGAIEFGGSPPPAPPAAPENLRITQ